jgi:hypothetical protein
VCVRCLCVDYTFTYILRRARLRVVVSRQQIIFQNAGDLLGCLELLFDDDEACSHPNQLSHLSASHPFLLPPSIQPTLYRLPPPSPLPSPPLFPSLSRSVLTHPSALQDRAAEEGRRAGGRADGTCQFHFQGAQCAVLCGFVSRQKLSLNWLLICSERVSSYYLKFVWS